MSFKFTLHNGNLAFSKISVTAKFSSCLHNRFIGYEGCHIQIAAIRLGSDFLWIWFLQFYREKKKSKVISVIFTILGGKNSCMPIHVAAQAGSVDCLQHLLKANPDTEVRDAYERTPLHLAAHFGHIECLQKLTQVS